MGFVDHLNLNAQTLFFKIKFDAPAHRGKGSWLGGGRGVEVGSGSRCFKEWKTGGKRRLKFRLKQ